MRVSRDSIQQLVGQASRQIAQVAGTAVGQQAGQILNDVAQSLFEGTSGAQTADRLPSALERLSQGLRGLGIDAATVGEVLNALNQLLGKTRRMRQEKTLKTALKKNSGLLSAEDEARLQDAIDSQAEAADLLSSLSDAQASANKSRMGKL
jgi:hypothetical protein